MCHCLEYRIVPVTHSKPSRSAVWLGLVLQTSAALCFHGLVLCVGANGHVAVEWLAVADCCPEEIGSTALAPGDCCDCTDAPLTLRVVGTRGAADPNDEATALLSTPAAEIDRKPRFISEPPDGAWPNEGKARRSVLLQV